MALSTHLCVLLALGLLCAPNSQAQRVSSRQRSHTISVKSGETLAAIAAREGLSAEELATTNGLSVNGRLRKGQRLVLPSSDTSTEKPGRPAGEVIGKRILFTDGGAIDVDDVWKQGDSWWYRLHGTSQSIPRPIKSVQDRYKTSTTTVPNVTTSTPMKTEVATLATWIYLVDGARLRVDEVREVSDGAWYNRGKLTVFLARDRITRIEREQPGTDAGDSGHHDWSSGNTQLDQLIHRNASRVGIDPYLVFLVIEQESRFHTRALSPKGAQGLMQLMPGTARRYGVSRPFDAADNIRGGTQYLKELLTMFNGRVDLALASYNAGEGRVLDYGNRVPPFKETRDYVKRISSRYKANTTKQSQVRDSVAGGPQ